MNHTDKLEDAFIYKWHVNNKFYVGVRKGTPDDGYTHSSKVKEFCDIVPNTWS